MKKRTDIAKFVQDNPKDSNIISLKISPYLKTGYSFCCCSGCLPEFWHAVNDKIRPQGPIEHEGSAILSIQNEQIILEQHESGPEIIAYLISLTTAPVYDILKWLLLSSISAFKEKHAAKIKLTRKITTTKQKVVDESTFEIDIDTKELGKIIDKCLK